MSSQDPYKVLGVGRDANDSDIQSAYRKLARKFHPDISKEPDAEDRFKEVQVAYEVLKDPEKRADYHRKQARGGGGRSTMPGAAPRAATPRATHAPPSPRSPTPRPQPSARPPRPSRNSRTDIPAQPTGDGGQAGRTRRVPRRQSSSSNPPPGPEETTLALSVLQAFQGGPRELTWTEAATQQRRRITVRVPKGVRDGQKIRLSGQGSRGGDLFLKVRVNDGDGFEMSGSDVTTTLKVSPTEAVLGGTAPITTLDGQVRMRIPPGSSSGTRIRLRDRGYPDKNGQRGDLYVEIRVCVPQKLSAEERKLYQRLARISKFNPRPR